VLEIAEGAQTLGQLTRASGMAREVARLAKEQGSVGIAGLAETLERAVRENARPKSSGRGRRFARALVVRVETAFQSRALSPRADEHATSGPIPHARRISLGASAMI
jgi:hypothetical protein